jgi:hypothetical protein
VAAQLAGVLVLQAAGAKEGTGDYPTLLALLRQATDVVRSARATERAHAHHHHLMLATEALDRALALARTRANDPLAALREAYDELQQASRTLPGFEMIHFAQGCCAVPRLA